jgi:hypothetical protein
VDGTRIDLGAGSLNGRWARFGPYYAMFPMPWAMEVVGRYSKEGDTVLDPFAGRGSSVYAAAAQKRVGVGIEINEVGWLFGRVKIGPASEARVLLRLREVESLTTPAVRRRARAMPEFFRLCYSLKVLAFLLSARSNLDWNRSSVDATLMAIILVYLHGRRGNYLSNQMRDTKAMAPDYSVRWWKAKGLTEPPDVDPVPFLEKRMRWRYAKGRPRFDESRMILGDSMGKLKGLSGKGFRFNLLFTSPPYYQITNYHYDQWIRLWMLGHEPTARRKTDEGPWRKKFESKERYAELLQSVFRDCARIMAKDAMIYVRTDAREFTRETTLAALRDAFPGKSITMKDSPLEKPSQTALFGDHSEKPGECDIVLQ